MERDPFKEYLKESEPDKAARSYAWSTAIGLQAVDGLKPSKYLIDTAIQNIEGKITIKEAQSLIDSYYKERSVPQSDGERTEEADKVSSRIAEILSEAAFSFSPNEYISIHRKLFQGIYKYAGKIETITSQRKNGCLTVQPSCMAALRSLEPRLNTISLRKKISATEVSRWMKSSTTLLCSFPDYGKFIFSVKVVQEQQRYSLSSILEHLVFPQQMIFLPKMPGTSGTHLSVRIIPTCKKVSTKQQSILKSFSEICY